jgi:hypothetical protein
MIYSHRVVFCVATVLALIVQSSVAHAQAALPGSRVRIVPLSGGMRVEGTLVAMTNDSLSYRPGLSDTMLTLPLDSVRSVFVTDGLHARTSHTLRSGLIGAGLGVAAGTLITALNCAHEKTSRDMVLPCGVEYVLLGVPLGAVGFLGGVLTGRSQKSEKWERVYDRSQSTSLIVGPAARGRVTLGLSVPFGSAGSR